MRKSLGILWAAAVLLLAAEIGGLRVFSDKEPGGAAVSQKLVLEGGGDLAIPEKKYIALTFDDGPHPKYTPMLLEGLRKRHVKVSFFLIGQNIPGNEDILRQMKEDGHLIGNHSQNHVQLNKETVEEACRQIDAVNQKLWEVTGTMPQYLRPPFGSWSETLEERVSMNVALWNIDPLDWKCQDRDQVVRQVVSHAKDGGIILLHDVYKTSVEAAFEIIDRLMEEGYSFVTIDELLIE